MDRISTRLEVKYTNKGIIIVGVVVLVLVGGGLFVANQQSKNAEQAKMEQEKAAMEKKETPEQEVLEEKAAMEKGDATKQDDAMMKKEDSRYVEYSKGVLDGSANKRRVLYFYANWCPTCKPANEDFTKNSNKIPEDMVVIRVNYNDTNTDQEEKDLAKKYAITYQHTFVQIDGLGKEVTKWNGGKTDDLLTNIK